MPQARPTSPRRRQLIRLGRTLGVPLLLAALVTAGSPGWGLYTIKRGDTLSDLAARYHTTVAKLVQVNKLPGNGSLIIEGRSLKVPGGSRLQRRAARPARTWSSAATRSPASRTATGSPRRPWPRRTACRAPTWSCSAPRCASPAAARGGGSTSSGGNTFAGRTYASHIVNAADRNRSTLARRGVPSREGMRSIIASRARANGVDPALALAVSYQESGWNQRSVSVANAVGAMQVIPATTEWISGVVGRRLNPLDPHDNATTGVVLLKILTQSAKQRAAGGGGLLPGAAIGP